MKAKDFLLNLPSKANKDVLEGHETTFHFVLSGEGEGDVTLKIKDGELKAMEGLEGEPKCTVKASGDNLMKLINKDINPMMAILMGKVKISNQGEMLKYSKILGLM